MPPLEKHENKRHRTDSSLHSNETEKMSGAVNGLKLRHIIEPDWDEDESAEDRIRRLVSRDLSWKNEPDVILAGLYQISQLCTSSKNGVSGDEEAHRINQVVLYQAGAHMAMIGAMEKYHDHALILAWGCHGLGLCKVSSTAASAIVGSGGIQVVLQAMTKFPDDQPLQFQACKALNRMTEEEESVAILVQLGGLEIIVATMRRFLASEYIQARSCSLLYACCKSDSYLDALREAKVAATIVEALEAHPKSQAIRKWARPVFNILLGL